MRKFSNILLPNSKEDNRVEDCDRHYTCSCYSRLSVETWVMKLIRVHLSKIRHFILYPMMPHVVADSEMFPLMKDESQYYWENNKAVVGMQYRINRLVTRNGAGYTLKVHILQWKG